MGNTQRTLLASLLHLPSQGNFRRDLPRRTLVLPPSEFNVREVTLMVSLVSSFFHSTLIHACGARVAMVSVLLLPVDTWIVPTLGYCWLCGFEHCVCVSWWTCPWSTPRSGIPGSQCTCRVSFSKYCVSVFQGCTDFQGLHGLRTPVSPVLNFSHFGRHVGVSHGVFNLHFPDV